MDSKELMQTAITQLEKSKDQTPSFPESSKPLKSDPQRIERLINEIPRIMCRYGIPVRFIDHQMVRPESIKLEMVKTGICLTGKAGVGKTTALCLLVRDWLIEKAKTNGHYWSSTDSWSFISFPEFIMQVQDSFRHDRGEQTAYEMLREIAGKPYLIIDDLGAEKVTEYVRQATYFIINHREMNMLPTFITTNFSMDHLDENIDSRISSRICGMCEVMRFEGKDQRIKTRRKEDLS